MNLRNLLDGDVFTYSCGEVQPGGYTQINTTSVAGAQFGVNEMERGFVERELAGQGFHIDFGWISPPKPAPSLHAEYCHPDPERSELGRPQLKSRTCSNRPYLSPNESVFVCSCCHAEQSESRPIHARAATPQSPLPPSSPPPPSPAES